jgi:hypothetical protein
MGLGADAAGGVDLDHVARLLADHRARDRRGDGDLAGLHVGLVLAHDLVAGRILGVLVHHGDRGAELHLVARQLGYVDDLCAGHPIFDVGDLAFDPALPLLSGMVLGVLGEIAMRTRFGDRGDHRRSLNGLQTLQVFVEGVVAPGGHRDFFHSRWDSGFALGVVFQPRAQATGGKRIVGKS